MKYLLPVISLWLVFCLGLPLQAQVKSLVFQGKTYTISADNLLIIQGKDPVIQTEDGVPKKVKANIELQYQKEIEEQYQSYQQRKINQQQLDLVLQQKKEAFQIANEQAEKLSKEFRLVDFRRQSYLYRFAYVLYNEGQIKEAVEVMADSTLFQLEKNNAVKYLLLAQAHLANDNVFQAEKIYKKALQRYPFFMVYVDYGNFLLSRGDIPGAKILFEKAMRQVQEYAQIQQLLPVLAVCYLRLSPYPGSFFY